MDERFNNAYRKMMVHKYVVEKKSPYRIVEELGSGGPRPRTIYSWLKRAGIRMRTMSDAQALAEKRVRREWLIQKYIKEGKPITEIAGEAGVGRDAVWSRLIKYNIPRRPPGGSKPKYPKRPFSGGGREMARLLGFRAGDFSAQLRGKQVIISVSTTHRPMLKLFTRLFGEWGHMYVGPQRGGEHRPFSWKASAHLHSSFSFLLPAPKVVPPQILNDDGLFFRFLAALTDSEGGFGIYPCHGRWIRFDYYLVSTNLDILNQIHQKLTSLGLRVRTYRMRKEGQATRGMYGTPKKACWQIRILNKGDIIWLAQKLLPLSLHDEKISRMYLVIEHRNSCHWSDVQQNVLVMRDRIKRETAACIVDAEKAWVRRHYTKVNTARE